MAGPAVRRDEIRFIQRACPFQPRETDKSMLIRSVISGALAALLSVAAASAQDTRHLLESKESLYNNIYVYEQAPYRSMTFGHNRRIYTESVYNTRDELDLPVDYTRFMTASVMYAKDVRSILEIGFGGGRTAWYLHRSLPKVQVTSVELDPTVLELAKKYFGIKEEPNFHVANRDGRLFVQESKERYDIILIDAYRGPFVPFHLLTKEFYQLVKDHLAEGGVVAQNVEPSTMLFDAAVKTIHSVFPQVDFYEAGGNIVMVGYLGDERKPEDLAAIAQERDKEFGFRYKLAEMLAQRKRIDIDGGQVIDANAKVLTDDFAPVEALKSIERHNRKLP